MAKFKAIAWPPPSEGKSFKGVELLTQPDQSMSLQEIIERFTRGEPQAIGKKVEFDGDPDMENPLNVDLEKLLKKDRVDRDEYFEQVNTFAREARKQQAEIERKKKQAAFDKAVREQAAKLAEKKAAEGGVKPSA